MHKKGASRGSGKMERKEVVWKQLERGGISKYIEKLHGYDPEVTNNMVKS